jgi:hypothetical protein
MNDVEKEERLLQYIIYGSKDKSNPINATTAFCEED